MSINELELVGIIAAVVAFWGQVTWILSWPLQLLIVRREVDADAGQLVLSYLAAMARSRPRNGCTYRADRIHVRPLGRSVWVFSENMLAGTKLFWLDRRPIWYGRNFQEHVGNSYVFSYMRWSVDMESLFSLAWQWEDNLRTDEASTRFAIFVHGTSMIEPPQSEILKATAQGGPPTSTSDLHRSPNGMRLLHWAQADLGYAAPIALDRMSLRPEIEELASDVGRFLDSHEWCEERGVPWRRGWLLHGLPGTGKSSFVRGIAIERGLPVHVFDVAALDNMLLRGGWAQMRRHAPCIALIEDIDAVYGVEREDGTIDCRANRQPGVGPSFDCLLNCIGGVDQADGVLLFITTNHVEHVDPALRRGGRLDRAVEFVGLDQPGRLKMIRRILGDGLESDLMATDVNLIGLSPADLQERLCRLAMARRFGGEA